MDNTERTEAALEAAEKHCKQCGAKDIRCRNCHIKLLKEILFSEIEKPLIYGIDFDGTIVEEKFPDIGEPIAETIDFIRKLQKNGHKWILVTMREGVFLENALEFLAINDILPDAVNDNLPERIEKWGNNPRKIYADVYVDDHNAGGLTLPEIPEKKRSC